MYLFFFPFLLYLYYIGNSRRFQISRVEGRYEGKYGGLERPGFYVQSGRPDFLRIEGLHGKRISSIYTFYIYARRISYIRSMYTIYVYVLFTEFFYRKFCEIFSKIFSFRNFQNFFILISLKFEGRDQLLL